MTDDFDELLKEAAKGYRAPPPTPRDEIWARIAARRAGQPKRPVQPIDLAGRRRAPWIGPLVAIAATLLVGIGIGRVTITPVPNPEVAAAAQAARANKVVRFAAQEHFGQVNALLTDYATGPITEDFYADARELLARTRLLLSAEQLSDPSTRRLLEDLELLLAQVARLAPAENGQAEERELIDDNMAERAIRLRLRDAIPAGPTA
jgi:hypothetical protein